MQNARIFSAKIDELEALIRLEDLETEDYARRVDTKKRANPGDEEIAGLVTQMRKKRKASAEHIKSRSNYSRNALHFWNPRPMPMPQHAQSYWKRFLWPIDQALGNA
jgi:hypothetical protein